MLSRFRHLLVPLDFASRNQPALEIAFEIAEVNQSRVTLLHVIEQIEGGVEDEETDDFYDRLRRRADAELESRSQRFVDAGLSTEYKLRFGKRVEEIVRFVVERDVDLVVLSSHPLDAGQPLRSLSTVSYQVSMLVTCPVLLVK